MQETFGQQLQRFRIRAGLTIQELTDHSQIGRKTITDWEKDRRVPRDRGLLQQLATALDLSPEEHKQLAAAAARQRTSAQGPAKRTVGTTDGVKVPRDTTDLSPALEHQLADVAAHQGTHGHLRTAYGLTRFSNFPSPHEFQLIGREQLIERLAVIFAKPEKRLLTLVGTGGVGKTQLALHLAQRVKQQFTTSYFVDLASITDPQLALPHIARSINLHHERQQAREMSYLDLLTFSFQSQPTLLVLDNVEQLLNTQAGLIETTSWISGLLEHTLHLKMIVTSRQPLNLSIEQQYLVPPLAVTVSADQDLSASPAIQLFITRAQQKDMLFEPSPALLLDIAAICKRLDGIPLAIELAAARIRHTGVPVNLIAHLDMLESTASLLIADLPARQRTMRDTIAWSYQLLNPDEQTFLRRLAVFVGGWSLPLAVRVCFAPGTEVRHAVNALSRFVDQSLLQVDLMAGALPRYTMFEMIREFALELLDTSEESHALHERHAHAVVVLAEELEPVLKGRDRSAVLSQLEAEHDNLRAAITWLLAHHHYELAGRLCSALATFWSVRGYAEEGLTYIQKVVQHGRNQMSEMIYAKVLYGAGWLSDSLNEYDQAMSYYQACSTLREQLNDQIGLAYVLFARARVARSRGNHVEAEQDLQASLMLVQEDADAWLTAAVLNILGWVQLRRDQFAVAERTLKHSYALAMRQVHDPDLRAKTLINLGHLCINQAEYTLAQEYFEQARSICITLGNWSDAARCLINLAAMATDSHDYWQAHIYLDELLPLLRSLGDKEKMVYGHLNRGELYLKQQRFAEARDSYGEALMIADSYQAGMLMGFALDGLACSQALIHDLEAAAQLVGVADSCYATSQTAPYAPIRDQVSQLLTQGLDATTSEALQRRGRLISTEHALKLINRDRPRPPAT